MQQKLLLTVVVEAVNNGYNETMNIKSNRFKLMLPHAR